MSGYTISCDYLKASTSVQVVGAAQMSAAGLVQEKGDIKTTNGKIISNQGFQLLIEGSNPPVYMTQKSVMTTITEGQVLALNQTPVKVVEPAGADLGVVIDNVVLYKAAGSSYQMGNATDISIGYAAGEALTTLQSALGLLGPVGAAVGMLMSAGKSLIPLANEGLYLKLAGGNVTGQGSGLIALINYKIIPTKLS